MSAQRSAPQPGFVRRTLAEPFVHFVSLGGLCFVLYRLVAPDPADSPGRIVVDDARVAALVSEYRRVWQRPPDPGELTQLTEAWVREEILYREGLAAGLDRDDAVVRRRVVQRMQFLAEGMAVDVPSDAELRRFFEEHADNYRTEPTFTLSQVFFDPEQHADLDRVVGRAQAALAADVSAPVGDRTMLPAKLSAAGKGDVARTFGATFAASLDGLPLATWQGPVRSAFGVHLVKLEARAPGGIPALSSVRQVVERDLMRQRTEQALAAFFEEARARYQVEVQAGALQASGAAVVAREAAAR